MQSESLQTSVYVSGVAAMLRRTRQSLVRVLEDISAEELCWRPDEGVNTAANLLWHLARMEEALVTRILLGRSLRRHLRSEFQDRAERDPAFYCDELARVRALGEGWLDQASDEELTAERTVSGPWGDSAFDLFHFLSHHDVHHRAQIVLLRKMVDPSRRFPDLG